MADQFATAPASSSASAEASANLRKGDLSQDDQHQSVRSEHHTASIPKVNIEQERIIHTRRVKLAQDLPYNKPYGEFLLALKDHVDTFQDPIESLYLEPVLILDRTTSQYELDLHVCNESIYRIITKLLEFHEQYDLFSMDQQQFNNFYLRNMKKFKTHH